MGILTESNMVGGPRLVGGTQAIAGSATNAVVDLSSYGGTAIKFAMGVIEGGAGPITTTATTYTTTATLTFNFTAVTTAATLVYIAFLY